MLNGARYRCLYNIRFETYASHRRSKKLNVAGVHVSLMKVTFQPYFFYKVGEVRKAIVMEREIIHYARPIRMQEQIGKNHGGIGYIRFDAEFLQVETAFFFKREVSYIGLHRAVAVTNRFENAGNRRQ